MVRRIRTTKITSRAYARKCKTIIEKNFNKIVQQLSITVTINVTIMEVINMTGKLVSPQVVQPGDHVLDKSHQVMVTHIEGPDHAGIYDFFGINEQGQGQIVSAQEFVHLLQ